MIVLGIETSCDETAASVVSHRQILSNIIASQHDLHAQYGGVVPELASRRHLERIVPVIQRALQEARITLNDIEGVAVTHAPGLVGALLVGLSAAKGIAIARGIPLIGVNHLEGHLGAACLEYPNIPLPFVGLVVSGGHTSLYLVREFGHYALLGATRDDAAGEAFDKVAKLMGLGFPGGPAIDHAAEQGDPNAFRFTKPKFDNEETLDFSFSGIKTAVLLKWKEARTNGASHEKIIADLAASFQATAVQFLVDRLFEAQDRTGAKAVVLVGGVASNRMLRRVVQEKAEARGISAFIPSLMLCTDNAAMIAFVGSHYLAKGKSSPLTINAIANQEIGR